MPNGYHFHDADQWIVDRARSEPVIVPRAAVSICGGFQPGVLKRALLTPRHLESRLAARFLFAYPLLRPVKWKYETIAPELRAKYAAAILRLTELQPLVTAEDRFEPETLRLSPRARQRYEEFFNDHGSVELELNDHLAAAWTKLRGYAARLALVLELGRWSDSDYDEAPSVVQLPSVGGAIDLVTWFGGQARRVYELTHTDAAEDSVQRTIEIVRRQGGAITARRLCKFDRSVGTVADANRRLLELVALEWGRWKNVPPSKNGGRPTRRFVLGDDDSLVGGEDT